MPRGEASLRSYYAARATEYDRVYQKPERQNDLLALQRWLPPLFSGRRLLEVACGTGYWTQFIAPAAREIVAIDIAIETINIAKSRVPKEKVRFVVADAFRLPQDLGKFDAVFAGFWFSHVLKQRRREFLVGLGALLAPGARVLMLDNLFVEGSNHPISERDAEGNTYQARKLDDGSTYRVLKNFPSEEELNALVVGLGQRTRFTKFEYYWAFVYETAGPSL